MSLLDFFRRKPRREQEHAQEQEEDRQSAVPLEQTSYDIAYCILPLYVFQSFQRIVDLCTKTPTAAGPFYYTMACQARGFEPDMEAAKQYKWHAGAFDGRNYLALQYPSPPPIDVGEEDLLAMMDSDNMIVLAPYYSVILYGDDSPPDYFILGQAPLGGGTTLRAITADGMNCNLGPGPGPRLDLFLAAIRKRQSGQKG